VEPAVTDPAALEFLGGAAPLLVGAAAADEGGLLLLPTLVGTAAAELGLGLGLELEPELGLAPGGVNGTVVLRGRASVVCTLAANLSKVLLPVAGALIAPYMPFLQCGRRPQKNQMGAVGSLTFNVNTLTWPEVLTKGWKPELNPFSLVAVLNCQAHGLAKLLWVTVWLPPRNSKLTKSPFAAVIC
jgi:hypothetical protein